MERFVLLLSPFAPHMAEELWQLLGHDETLAYEPWPAYDEALLARGHGRGAGAGQRQAPRADRGAGRQPTHAALEAAARADAHGRRAAGRQDDRQGDRRAGPDGELRGEVNAEIKFQSKHGTLITTNRR